MKSTFLSVKIHTIEQLLAPFGISNPHKGLHVVDANPNDVAIPILYPFRSDHFTFFVITQGELTVKVNLMEYQLKKDDVLMLTPNALRQFISITADCRIISVVFTGDYLSGTSIHAKNVDAYDFLSSQMVPMISLTQKETAFLLPLLKMLELKINAEATLIYQDEVLLNMFTAFIYEISALYQKQESITTVKGSRKEELAVRFLKMLPQHFKQERSVQAYAGMLNVTPKYLSQTVKELTGKTAGDFIDEMVIMEAKVVLNDLTLTIAQVADYLNFSDQFFFSKFFKKHSGMSPSQYRHMA